MNNVLLYIFDVADMQSTFSSVNNVAGSARVLDGDNNKTRKWKRNSYNSQRI
jgi:hypothetical protein